jgi:hypothetical protein
MAGKLVIKVNGFGQGTVELDGTDIANSVRAVEFRADSRGETTVSLDLTVDEVEITCLGARDREYLVNLDDSTINTLLALGWNPPQSDVRTYRVPATEWVSAEEFETYTLNERRSAEEMDIIDRQSPDAND